jgi:hypothetical protein
VVGGRQDHILRIFVHFFGVAAEADHGHFSIPGKRFEGALFSSVQ